MYIVQIKWIINFYDNYRQICTMCNIYITTLLSFLNYKPMKLLIIYLL